MFGKLFPYGMQEQQDGSWVFYNRSYKPVGTTLDRFPPVEYKDYPVCFKLEPLEPDTIAKLNVEGRVHPDPRGEKGENMIFFYDEQNHPLESEEKMTAYLEKLKILMRLQGRGTASK